MTTTVAREPVDAPSGMKHTHTQTHDRNSRDSLQLYAGKDSKRSGFLGAELRFRHGGHTVETHQRSPSSEGARECNDHDHDGGTHVVWLEALALLCCRQTTAQIQLWWCGARTARTLRRKSALGHAAKNRSLGIPMRGLCV